MSKSIQLKDRNNENMYPYALLKEFVLYDNTSGSNGGVTLSDNVTNYKYIEIFFKWDNTYKSIKIYNANNKSALLDMLDYNNTRIVFATKVVTISNTSITVNRYKYYTIADNTSWIPYGSNTNAIYITRVVGYK